MRQVIFIHGGTTFYRYEDYLNGLRTKTIRLERLTSRQRFWFERLQENLGNDYQVLTPSMPNKQNARYEEWCLWFERVAEVIEDDCILIGHSLGGIFLPKYLSEHAFPKQIRATILVAAPYEDESHEDLTDFKITGSLDRFASQAGKIIFYHGTNDIVPLSELELYKKALPSAETHELDVPDHFMRESFPEILDSIRDC